MFADKYPSIFSRQMKAIVYILINFCEVHITISYSMHPKQAATCTSYYIYQSMSSFKHKSVKSIKPVIN